MICVLNSNTASKQDHSPRTEQKNAVPIWKQKQRILARHVKKIEKQMINAELDAAIMKHNTGEKKPHDQAP
jgi:3-phenylpropionate/cinnamic acid dioxygenase small subunit